MTAVPEGDVAVLAARDVEVLGVGELHRIAVGCAQQQVDLVARRNLVALDLDRLAGTARGQLNGAVQAQHLLDRARDELGSRAQAHQLRRVPQQRLHSVPDQVRGGLVTRAQQQHRGRDHLFLGEGVVQVTGHHQPRQQVVAGLPLAQRDLARKVVAQLDRGARGLVDPGLADRPVQEHRHLVGPALEEAAVLDGRAQKLTDHDHRQGRRELRHHVHAARDLGLVDQLVGDLLDARPQLLDDARREGAVHQPAQARVIGRVPRQHHAARYLEQVDQRRVAAGAHQVDCRLRELARLEARVAQRGDHVEVAAEQPDPLPARERSLEDRRLAPQRGVDGVGVGLKVGRREVTFEAHGGSSCAPPQSNRRASGGGRCGPRGQVRRQAPAAVSGGYCADPDQASSGARPSQATRIERAMPVT